MNRRVETLVNRFESEGAKVSTVAIASKKLPRIFRFSTRSTIRTIKSALREKDPHVVCFAGIEFALVSRLIKTIPVLVDICDSQISLAVRASKRNMSLCSKLKGQLSARMLLLILPKSAYVSYISLDDLATDLPFLKNGEVAWFSNQVEKSLAESKFQSDFLTSIGFLADFSYPPNQEGFDWFQNNVLPLIEPSLEILLFGPVPPPNTGNKVIYKGYVPELSEVFNQIQLSIAPDFSGSGQKNKVLESIAAKIPVLATSLAAKGFESVDSVIVMNDATEWASFINKMHVDGGLVKFSKADGAKMLLAQELESSANFKILAERFSTRMIQ